MIFCSLLYPNLCVCNNHGHGGVDYALVYENISFVATYKLTRRMKAFCPRLGTLSE